MFGRERPWLWVDQAGNQVKFLTFWLVLQNKAVRLSVRQQLLVTFYFFGKIIERSRNDLFRKINYSAQSNLRFPELNQLMRLQLLFLKHFSSQPFSLCKE